MDIRIEAPHAKGRSGLHNGVAPATIENCGSILTVSETAQILKVSETTIYTLIRAGKLDAVRITKKLYRVPRDSLVEFLGLT